MSNKKSEFVYKRSRNIFVAGILLALISASAGEAGLNKVQTALGFPAAFMVVAGGFASLCYLGD